MKINVIQGGTAKSFGYLMFPNQNPGNQIFIDQQFENMNAIFTGIGHQFMEQTRKAYEAAKNSDAMRIAQAALRTIKSAFHPNMIRDLISEEDFQMAKPVMQRYVMASPYIRALYQANRCDGYRGSYVDLQPGAIGDNHYDYRRAMQGIAAINEEDNGEPDWSATIWVEDLQEGDRELEAEEQNIIGKVWRRGELPMEQGRDLTNIYGGEIGR